MQDKLFLPGLLKLKMLRDSGFFGRMLAVRGEFGYWVFEGDLQPTQRPSWNYRAEDGGGIILDMLCHWRYVLDHVFGAVQSLTCLGATHITERFDENRKPYEGTAEDAAYATFMLEDGVVAHINSSWQTRVYRDDLVTFQVDGTHGSAVAGLQSCKIQQRMATPRPVWNPGREAHRRFSRRLAGGARHRALSERFSPAMGDVHPPRRRRRALASFAARRREGRAARRARAGELEESARWIDVPPLSLAASAPAEEGRACRLTRGPAKAAGVELRLPTADRSVAAYRMGAPSPFPASASGPFNRVAFAAAHVVSDPLAEHDPWLTAAIDWDATIAYRRHLWGLGFSVAEAMDTAQRGMGLDWPNALELIRRSAAAAKADGHRMLASGAGTDHLDPAAAKSVDDVIRAYEEQFEAVEAAGSPIILMASRALVRVARSADDYLRVYDRLLSPGARAGDHPLARRHVRSAARRLLGIERRADRDGDRARRRSARIRKRWPASRSRCSTRAGKSRCGDSFRPASAC